MWFSREWRQRIKMEHRRRDFDRLLKLIDQLSNKYDRTEVDYACGYVKGCIDSSVAAGWISVDERDFLDKILEYTYVTKCKNLR